MSRILVLVDHVEGSVRKTTTELLTIARRLGDPVAVFLGPGHDRAAAILGEYGATASYVVEGDLDDYLVVAKAEAVLAAVEAAGGPGALGAVLVTSGAEGKEIAARLAVRLGSGIITDAVDVQAGPDGAPVTR